MTFLTSRLRKWLLVPLGAGILGVAIGAGGAELARAYVVEGPAATQLFIFPGGNLNNDGDVAKLDTRTGGVYRYRGDLKNPNVRGTWELRVAPPKESNSGMLEVQRIVFPTAVGTAGDVEAQVATFLVDIVTGQTWVLRLRASSNGSWDYIGDFNRSNWGNS